VTPMSTALLLAETEPGAHSILARHLSHDGFEVVLELGEGRRVDLALLPDADGCGRVREQAGDVPVIVIGSPGFDSIDRMRALERGADDVVPHPFEYEELLARIRAVLRRTGSGRDANEIGELRIDRATRRVTVSGTPVELAGKEFDLLVALAADPARVFTKAELLRDVWGYPSSTRTRTLDSHACRLRRKLAELTDRPFVVNVWGVGYKLVEAVT
jgi:DNA-binding response OmpR family regulator